MELKHCSPLIGQRESSVESSRGQHMISCTNLPFLNSQAPVKSDHNFLNSLNPDLKKKNVNPQNYTVH